VVAAVICLQKRSRFRSHSACLHAARCLSHAFKLWVRLTFSVSFTWSDVRLPPTAQRQFPLKNGACDCSLCLHDMTSRLFARQTFQLPLIPTPERPKHLSSTSTLPLLFAIQDSQLQSNHQSKTPTQTLQSCLQRVPRRRWRSQPRLPR
jgi:hypothetical protein